MLKTEKDFTFPHSKVIIHMLAKIFDGVTNKKEKSLDEL